MADVNRKCGRCSKVKPIEEFVGKKPNAIVKTCLTCREDIDGKKNQGLALRKALRELFMQGNEPLPEQGIAANQ